MNVLEPPSDGDLYTMIRVSPHENNVIVFDSPLSLQKVSIKHGVKKTFSYNFMMISYVEKNIQHLMLEA